ncbi:spore germination protein [Desulfitobacterium metallireducens]|uniref:Spore germination protein KA n=1 Tax=Desulfitobacterium metallireducens DSM 15288 TaxID=871968 RepID=W0E4N5_9FIRM|nr:spore germination protein [Desulfitobacterium metallireducens]AHF05815.1 spore germination protein KA [Desulfitobacterium metallireducens DSM 15288]
MPIKKLVDELHRRKYRSRRQQQNTGSSDPSQNNSQTNSQADTQGSSQDNADSLSENLDENLQKIQTIFEESSDLITREFKIGADESIKAFIVMLNGLIDVKAVNADLIKPLMFLQHDVNKSNALNVIKESALSVAMVKEGHSFTDVTEAILSGDTVLFIEESNIALIAALHGWKARNVDQPETTAVVRGPREGFVESIGTNMALLRRKMKNPALKFYQMQIGKQTKTTICVAYLKGIVDIKIVDEVKQRLQRIDTDSILESGYIESYIEDAPQSIFPTVGNSEKPDIVSAKLLEGRVAILVDGTPFVLTVPYLFIEAFQNAEDYYSRPFYSSFIRWLRWLAFFFTTTTPALYVAFTTYHQEFLPPALLVTIAAAEEGTPFPSMVEALLMQTIYEILREAGVRLPRPVGQAVSIVGALVIGDAAISSGIAGAPMVVVTALTAISSFVVPSLVDISTLARFILIILAGSSGLYGVMLGFIVFVTHQVSLRSLGVPYMSPLAPTTFSDLKDLFIRVPLWLMHTRPRLFGGENPTRQKSNLRPTPPNDPKGEN